MTIKDGIKYVVIFASGAVSGVFVTKSYFEKRTNEEIASVKESLSTMIHLKKPEKKEEKESDDIPVKRDPRKAEVVVDYSGYTKAVKEYSAEDEDPAESESPSDEDDDVKNYLDGKRDSEAPRREPRLIKY
jgi:hypothetical protein